MPLRLRQEIQKMPRCVVVQWLTPRTHRAHKSQLTSLQAQENGRPTAPLALIKANQ